MLMPKSPREKLVVKILAGVLGLIVVVLAVKMVAGGGAKKEASTTPIVNAQGPSRPEQQKPAKHKKGSKKQETLVFTGVDPFEPLIAPAPEPTAAAPAPEATPSTQPSSQPGATMVIQGTTLTLVDLPVQGENQTAQVMVNGILYQLMPGDSFGNGFALVSISPPCADFTWGQESFRLCLTSTTP